ncbi:MAG TPA: HepT-like ribonuclease domain-containing protein [Salinarimonas sp.]|nr:HepT-like ribonuclease domain-containing protein [Salinarimonas sp.]
MTRAALDRLSDARRAIDAIVDAAIGLERDLFVSKGEIQHAALDNLILIGETLGQVAPTTKALAPDVRWRSITGMRNVRVHAYRQADPLVVGSVVIDELPRLDRQREALIQDLQGPAA